MGYNILDAQKRIIEKKASKQAMKSHEHHYLNFILPKKAKKKKKAETKSLFPTIIPPCNLPFST